MIWIALWMLTPSTLITLQQSKLHVKYWNSNRSNGSLTKIMRVIYCVNFKMKQAKVVLNTNFPPLLGWLVSLNILSPQSSSLSEVTLFPRCLTVTLHLLHQVYQLIHQKLFVQEIRLHQGSSESHGGTQRSDRPVWSSGMCCSHFPCPGFEGFLVCMLLIQKPFLVRASRHLRQVRVAVSLHF